MPTSSRSLHPVYTALDNHQYQRAVKLCQGLDPANTLGRALLAHAYAKSGQRFKALITLREIFSADDCFPELQLAIKYECSTEAQQEQAVRKPDAGAAGKKNGPAPKKSLKKGKKKGTASNTATAASAAPEASAGGFLLPTLEEWDLVDRLDTPPVLPQDWDVQLPGTSIDPEETLVDTLAMVMSTQLRLPLTTYQLFCWAVSFPSIESQRDVDIDLYNTKKLYHYGLRLLLHPQYNHITPAVLSNLQLRALQISKLQQHPQCDTSSFVPATLWAAQTALWRIQLVPKDQPPSAQDRAMLPRLAESLALKCYQQQPIAIDENDDSKHDQLVTTECFLLYLRALEEQEKWDDMLVALNTLTTPQDRNADWVLLQKVQVLQRLGSSNNDELLALTESLVCQYPDDWEHWQAHWAGCCNTNDADAAMEKVQKLIVRCLEKDHKKVLRAPRLMKLELAVFTDSQAALIAAVQDYGNDMSSKASSVFSDLESYLNKVNVEGANTLLNWADALMASGSQPDDTSGDFPKVQQKALKTYIFGTQVNFKMVSLFTRDYRDRLPEWGTILAVWSAYRQFEQDANLHQAQKEQRPPDSLVLLAVQRILFDSKSNENQLLAATLLEEAMQYSPDNAYLKITAMFVYEELHAVSRSWELYKALHIKHVQNESCSYIMMPLLRSGGLFPETMSLCHEIQSFQRVATKETADGVRKAMEHGAMTKAEEFITFQRRKLTASLTALEAKSLILDMAPLIGESGSIGEFQGIVGGDADHERVEGMIIEAYNPSGPFRLFHTKSSDHAEYCDNRDLSILDNDILHKQEFESSPEIWQHCHTRRHQHGLLARLSLCIMVASGPKKGKAVKASSIAERRCKSILTAAVGAAEFLEDKDSSLYCHFLRSIIFMSYFVACLVGGLDEKGHPSFESLLDREKEACRVMALACSAIEAAEQQLFQHGTTLPLASCLLHESITPAYSCFVQCSKLAETFGWGRRKRKTKPCAASIASFAMKLSCITSKFISGKPVSSVSAEEIATTLSKSTGGFVHDAMVEQTIVNILKCQAATSNSLEPFYIHMTKKLDEFNGDE